VERQYKVSNILTSSYRVSGLLDTSWMVALLSLVGDYGSADFSDL